MSHICHISHTLHSIAVFSNIVKETLLTDLAEADAESELVTRVQV